MASRSNTRTRTGARAPARAPFVPPTMAEAMRSLNEKLAVRVDEAAVLLELSRHTAYVAVKAGDIPSFRIGGVIRVPSAALRALLHVEKATEAKAS